MLFPVQFKTGVGSDRTCHEGLGSFSIGLFGSEFCVLLLDGVHDGVDADAEDQSGRDRGDRDGLGGLTRKEIKDLFTFFGEQQNLQHRQAFCFQAQNNIRQEKLCLFRQSL